MASKRLVLISSDSHAGADLTDYRAYLPESLRGDFDDWAGSFSDAWGQFDSEEHVDDPDRDMRRVGVSSFLAPCNWDSDLRQKHLEAEGIVGEVIFPNTVPPFYPSSTLTAPSPRTADEYTKRWAGIKAHNRWLADFCNALPGRRAGMAQIFLNDLDDAIAEVTWAKNAGLSGVLLPGDHHAQLVNLYPRYLDRFWSACADLDMPVHRHSQSVSEAVTEETGPAAAALGIYEAITFLERTLPQIMLGGVCHRHPTLKFVFTEATGVWVVPVLQQLDAYYAEARVKGTAPYMFGRDAVWEQDLLPSEQFARNCYIGSFLTDFDISQRYQIGADRIMWGADYPHHEGTWPYTLSALRLNFGAVPDEEIIAMTSGTAAHVYGFDVDQLQTVADSLDGPTLDDLRVPVAEADIPADTGCPTFKYTSSVVISGQPVAS